MTRTILGAAAALTLLVVATPAGAVGSDVPVSGDEKQICVLTNSEKREGYCVSTYGVHVPKPPQLPQLPQLP